MSIDIPSDIKHASELITYVELALQEASHPDTRFYTRSRAALRLLTDNLTRIHLLGQCALWGAPKEPELARALHQILLILQNGQAIDDLIARSSLGTPEVKEARECVNPTDVDRVMRRVDDLRSWLCLACRNRPITQVGKFCFNCRHDGKADAYQHGVDDARE